MQNATKIFPIDSAGLLVTRGVSNLHELQEPSGLDFAKIQGVFSWWKRLGFNIVVYFVCYLINNVQL